MVAYRFQALGPLQAGEGSRAFLGLAISPDLKARPVVIIWVPEAAEKDPELLAKIRRETEHAAQLDHPHIVTVMGFAKLDEGHARVVEFADGESLRKVLDTCKKLPPRIAARVILDACTAIHYAHVAGNDDGAPLVHGDLRPETLLISFQGVTKVTGYGALAFAPRELGGQRVKGRRVHSAPEQIIGGRDAVTINTDVYLLGVALYECLTGVVPWADQGDFFDHAVLTLPLPPATPGEIPEKLEAIIVKACAKKANDRYATPLAMREAIEAAVGDEVANDEELARFLEALFPQSHQLRADRRHTIDAGIADFVRRQWAENERTETRPMMRAVQLPPNQMPPTGTPAPPPPKPPAAPVKPVTRQPPPRPIDREWTARDDEDERRDEGSSGPWIILLALFIAIVAGWWAWKKANEPIPGIDPIPQVVTPQVIVDAGAVAEIDAGLPSVQVDSDAGPEIAGDAGVTEATVDAGDSIDSGTAAVVPTEPIDAGTAPPSSDAGEVTTVAPASGVEVAIDSNPRVELFLEGKSLGKTPWKGALPPGKKSFTLQNKVLGINATRTVTVRTEPVAETFTFEKGFVTVVAPAGGVVFIDGAKLGVAPLSPELGVYEGFHRIVVTVGRSKWSETFTMYAGQRVTFNVELQ